MTDPWPSWLLVLPILLVGVAYLIKHLLSEIFEEDHHFVGMIATFLALCVVTAFVLRATIPAPSGPSNIRSLGQIVNNK